MYVYIYIYICIHTYTHITILCGTHTTTSNTHHFRHTANIICRKHGRTPPGRDRKKINSLLLVLAILYCIHAHAVWTVLGCEKICPPAREVCSVRLICLGALCDWAMPFVQHAYISFSKCIVVFLRWFLFVHWWSSWRNIMHTIVKWIKCYEYVCSDFYHTPHTMQAQPPQRGILM
jgi:hypothetical protein